MLAGDGPELAQVAQGARTGAAVLAQGALLVQGPQEQRLGLVKAQGVAQEHGHGPGEPEVVSGIHLLLLPQGLGQSARRLQHGQGGGELAPVGLQGAQTPTADQLLPAQAARVLPGGPAAPDGFQGHLQA